MTALDLRDQMAMAALTGLLAKLDAAKTGSNELDVLIEVALFEPDDDYVACRANNAGTKVIYTRRDGRNETCCAPDRDPADAADRVRAMLAERNRTTKGEDHV